MISLTSATRRAEEFDAAVSGHSSQDTLRPELAELLDVVGAMRGIDVPAPRPDFVADLRERLLEEAETALARDAVLTLPPRRKGRERRLAVAASAFVLVGGTAGMAAAAQNALPGDALYPIKRGIESVQTELSRGNESKGQHLLDQAGSRLDEVSTLVSQQADEPEVTATLDDFVSQANQGSSLILASSSGQQDQAAVEEVRSFTASSMDTLAYLAGKAPADLQDSFAEAADALRTIDQRAVDSCMACADMRAPLRLAAAFSATADAERAMKALAATTINNDHPTIGGIKDPSGGKGGGTGGGTQSAGGKTDSATATPDEQLPGTTAGDDGGLLQGLGDAADSLTGGTETSGGSGLLDDVTGPVKDTVKDKVDKVKDDAEQPLDDTLDQLLP